MPLARMPATEPTAHPAEPAKIPATITPPRRPATIPTGPPSPAKLSSHPRNQGVRCRSHQGPRKQDQRGRRERTGDDDYVKPFPLSFVSATRTDLIRPSLVRERRHVGDLALVHRHLRDLRQYYPDMGYSKLGCSVRPCRARPIHYRIDAFVPRSYKRATHLALHRIRWQRRSSDRSRSFRSTRAASATSMSSSSWRFAAPSQCIPPTSWRASASTLELPISGRRPPSAPPEPPEGAPA